MTLILRVKARWSGFAGAPGYTVFHFGDDLQNPGDPGVPNVSDADAAVRRTHEFFQGLQVQFPQGVHIQVESAVDVIEHTTDTLVDVLGAEPAQQVTGFGQGGYAAAAGAVVNWGTSTIRNGRRLGGRTFLVPLSGAAYSLDGTLEASVITALGTVSTELTDRGQNPDLLVYGRPTGPGASDGVIGVVNSFRVPDMSAVLRSRR
jgi:hypothetical protein